MITFQVLGPVTAHRAGIAIDLGRPTVRRVLALLLTNPGRPLSVDQMLDELWPEEPPQEAKKALQVYVHRLRRALSDEKRVVHGPAGYAVRVAKDELDTLRVTDLAERARIGLKRGNQTHASELLTAALGLWRGEPFAGVQGGFLIAQEVRRLDQQRLLLREERISIGLDLGWDVELTTELQELTLTHPFHEKFAEQLMLALYRQGRQAEALEIFHRTRSLLLDQLGIEPGVSMRRLHEAMLRAEDWLMEVNSRSELALAAAVRPHELPSDVAGFVGRTAETKTLDDLIPSRRGDAAAGSTSLALITGPPGVGKTALAVHWGHRVLDEFPDGQLYIDLRGYSADAPVEPAVTLSRFLRSLGLHPDRIPVDAAESAALYRSLLSDRRVLVVLDNAKSVSQIRPLVPGDPGCMVLVTSRDRLGGLVAKDGAHRVNVDVLSPTEAGDLLTVAIGPERIHADPVASDQLAEVCGYLPLALRIAAANLDDHRQRPISGHVAAIRRNLLDGLAVDGDIESAVRAAFDLSYQDLHAKARVMFRRLGLQPGPDFTTEAAAQLSGITVVEATEIVLRLAETHLVRQAASGRFAMHDLLRQYARDRAHLDDDEAEQISAVNRLLSWQLGTSIKACDLLYPDMLRMPIDQLPTAVPSNLIEQWFDLELQNLVASIRYAAQAGPKHVAWLLGDNVRGYFDQSRHMLEWLTVARASLAAARTAGDKRAQAAALHSLAHANGSLARYGVAIGHLKNAIKLSAESGWIEGQAAMLGNLGIVSNVLGRSDEAVEYLSQAWRLHQQLGWPLGQANALHNLAVVLRDRGELEAAQENGERALALFDDTSVPTATFVIANLGDIAHLRGRLTEAEDYLTRALLLHRQNSRRYGEAATLASLGRVARDLGRLDDARRQLNDAIAIAQDIGERREEINAINELASVHAASGQVAHATALYEVTWQRATRNAAHKDLIDALIGLAAGRLSQGTVSQAHFLAKSAVKLAIESGRKVHVGRARTVLARAHLASADITRAEHEAQLAVDCHHTNGHRLGEAEALAVLAEVLTARSDHVTAQLKRSAARQIIRKTGAPEPSWLALPSA